jgi:hypothetical protein
VSSAILYVAIVAIWIGVLVPRWLKHDNSQNSPAGLRRFSRHFGGSRHGDGRENRVGFGPEGRPRYTGFVPPEAEKHSPEFYPESQIDHEEKVSSPARGNRESMAQLYQADAPSSQVRSYGWSAEEAAYHERLKRNKSRAPSTTREPVAPVDEHASQAPRAPRADDRTAQEAEHAGDAYYRDEAADAEQRARVMRGRRRMLWLLVVLTVAGIGLTYLKLASWWIMVPPVVLLGGYLLLLREAAQADAEARERRELADAAAPATEAAPAAPAAEAASAARGATHETGPRAEIIDLSEHVGDQLYDQYADAKLRAVGD